MRRVELILLGMCKERRSITSRKEEDEDTVVRLGCEITELGS